MAGYLIASIGIMFIVKYGSVLQWFRNVLSKLHELFACSLCLGFWAGVIQMPLLYMDRVGWKTLIFPFMSAAICWIADTLLQFTQGLDQLVIRILKSFDENL